MTTTVEDFKSSLADLQRVMPRTEDPPPFDVDLPHAPAWLVERVEHFNSFGASLEAAGLALRLFMPTKAERQASIEGRRLSETTTRIRQWVRGMDPAVRQLAATNAEWRAFDLLEMCDLNRCPFRLIEENLGEPWARTIWHNAVMGRDAMASISAVLSLVNMSDHVDSAMRGLDNAFHQRKAAIGWVIRPILDRRQVAAMRWAEPDNWWAI